MEDSFRLFVQLSIATAGGFIWLKIQPDANAAADLFPLVRYVLPLLALFTMVQIGSDLWGWFRYRREEATLLGRADLNPRLCLYRDKDDHLAGGSGRLELFRIFVAAPLVGCLGFVYLR